MKSDHYNFCMFCGYGIDRVDFLAITSETSICSHCAKEVIKMWKEERTREEVEK